MAKDTLTRREIIAGVAASAVLTGVGSALYGCESTSKKPAAQQKPAAVNYINFRAFAYPWGRNATKQREFCNVMHRMSFLHFAFAAL